MASENVLIVNEGNFEAEVLKSDVPVLVDFYAEWCGPCKMLAPLIDQIANEKKGQVKVTKIDIDNNHGLAAQYGIRAVPTMLVFAKGQVRDQIVGMTTKKDLEAKLAAA
ncbi:thioredoxin [Oscillatoria laete-virens NRMC-F 0139]|nr:thioredoxin [Oscillatoria laete-virens]MDL5054480.1 thioredoxin [Oscillatoria laete-virens NRMC-F 0139]